MKLIDMMKRVDRSKGNSVDGDIDDFCRELGIENYFGWDQAFSERVQGYYLIKWFCTDSWVGAVVYIMDDKPVAISYQSGRKSGREFEFVSKEAVEKVRAFILSLIEQEDRYSLLNLEEELDEFYTVDYTSQLLVNNGFVDGKPCVVETNVLRGWEYTTCKEVGVKFEDGSTKTVSIKDFKIPCHFI